MKTNSVKSVVMVAGEASGDRHGAHVIRALKKRHAEIAVSGAGGKAMRTAGADIIVDIDQLSVMGFTALFSKVPVILKAASRLKKLVSITKPDLVVLIDFPEFNLHLAGYAKKQGVPVLYYISPQLWAWRAGRIHKIKARVDHMAVILPFETSIYARHNIPVTFVGHPLMDTAPPQSGAGKKITKGQSQMTVSLLPGSRVGEVGRLLPEMLGAAERLQKKWPEMKFLLSCAPTIDRIEMHRVVETYRPLNLEITEDSIATLFAQSHLAVVASGTASLEAAVYGIPSIIVYSMSAINYLMGKLFVRVSHIGLANLIAQKSVMPELIQANATARNIASMVEDLLSNTLAYEAMQKDLIDVRRQLGHSGASDRVAAIACELMQV